MHIEQELLSKIQSNSNELDKIELPYPIIGNNLKALNDALKGNTHATTISWHQNQVIYLDDNQVMELYTNINKKVEENRVRSKLLKKDDNSNRSLKPQKQTYEISSSKTNNLKNSIEKYTLITAEVKPTLHDESLILKVWESHIQKKQLKYLVSDQLNEATTLFNGMSLQSEAAILINADNTLYQRQSDGKSLSFCSSVNHENRASVESGYNAISSNFKQALNQLKTWQEQESNQPITNHIILFPYRITSAPKHWALGVAELGFGNDRKLNSATIAVYNPLPTYGGKQINDTVRQELQNGIQTIFENNTILLQIAEPLEGYKRQQYDGNSCGPITAENGKDFIDGVENIPNSRLMTEYPEKAINLRLQHFNEVGDDEFIKKANETRDYENQLPWNRLLKEPTQIKDNYGKNKTIPAQVTTANITREDKLDKDDSLINTEDFNLKNLLKLNSIKQPVSEWLKQAEELFNQKQWDKARQYYIEALAIANHNRIHCNKREDSKIINCFCKLAEISFNLAKEIEIETDHNKNQLGDYLLHAIMFYNAAHTISKKYLENFDAQYLDDLQTNIKACENLFIEKITGKKSTSESSMDEEHRKTWENNILAPAEKDLAKLDKLKIKTVDDEIFYKRAQRIEKIYKTTADAIKALLNAMLQECQSLIGEKPCSYALISFGSLAKQSATPYSDIEFGILIEEGKDSIENKRYFRNLSYLLAMKITNLGQTVIPQTMLKANNDLEINLDDILSPGFQLDLGSKTPLLNKEKSYDLIQTPSNMFAKYLLNYQASDDKLLATELASFAFIGGNENLANDYQKLINEKFSYEKFAKKILTETTILATPDLQKYNPEPIRLIRSRNHYNIKREVYRSVDRLIEGLRLLYVKTSANHWDTLEQLHDKGKLSEAGKKNVKIVLSIAVRLRLKAYVNNKSQIENYTLNFDEEIKRFYCTIIPLHEQIASLYNKSNLNVEAGLKNNSLFDQSYKIIGKVALKFEKYEEACKKFAEWFKREADNPEAHYYYALTKAYQHDTKTAADHAYIALNKFPQTDLQSLSNAMGLLASCIGVIGSQEKEQELLADMLSFMPRIPRASIITKAQLYHNIIVSAEESQNFSRAEEYLKLLEREIELLWGNIDKKYHLENFYLIKHFFYYNKASVILNKNKPSLNKNHLDECSELNKKALECLEKAEACLDNHYYIFILIFSGDINFYGATISNSYGYEKAYEEYKKALDIGLEINYRSLTLLKKLGDVCNKLELYKEAIGYFDRLIIFYKQNKTSSHNLPKLKEQRDFAYRNWKAINQSKKRLFNDDMQGISDKLNQSSEEKSGKLSESTCGLFKGIFSKQPRSSSLHELEQLMKKYELANTSQPMLEKGLRKAAVNNQVEDLQKFIVKVSNINAQDSGAHKKTALHWAVIKGHVACVQSLIAADARLDIEDGEGKTAISYASSPKINQLFERKDNKCTL
jgi:predicted nucleotidyltransferase